ncbi:MAG: 30S ribosomal protein S11 [Candidatus Gracilibacteria bacterium]|jgi:small subunit ribosomal protein S11
MSEEKDPKPVKTTEVVDSAAKVDAAAPQGEVAAEGATEVKKIRRSKKKSVTSGRIYIKAGFNNTIVTITDNDGKAVAWATSGSCGFKGSKKATPFAAQMAAENAAEKAKVYGFEKGDVYVSGVGHGREQAMRGLIAQNIAILKIVDTTPVPHNGCRVPRVRRV